MVVECNKKRKIFGIITVSVLLLSCGLHANDSIKSDTRASLKILVDKTGFYVLLMPVNSFLKVDRRFVLNDCKTENENSSSSCAGNLGFEIVDSDGRQFFYHNQSGKMDSSKQNPLIMLFPGQVVGISVSYCQIVKSFSLVVGVSYKIRAKYFANRNENGVFLGPLTTEWIELSIPKDLRCERLEQIL